MRRPRKSAPDPAQLSLFAEPYVGRETKARASAKSSEPTTVLDFVRARFEHGPEMTPEEYRHWIKVLIHSSLKRLD